MLEAVTQYGLSIEDCLGVDEAGEECPLGLFAKVGVSRCHDVEERVQLQVLLECLRVRWSRRVEVEAPVAVHEVHLHPAIRPFNSSYERRYLSASAQA